MSKISIPLLVMSLLAMLGIGLAVYYRSQSDHFEQEYRRLLATLSAPTQSSPVIPGDETALPRPVRPVAGSREERVTLAPAAERVVAGAVTNGAGAPDGANRFRRRFEDRLESMRTNDPQRYAEMVKRREAMQQQMQSAWGHATNYFMNRDTTRMTQGDREEYGQMVNLLGQLWALNQQLQSGLPPDVRQEVMSDLRSNVVAVMPLLDSERNREYYDAALAMGMNEQDAATMVDYVNQITSNTSLRTIMPGMRLGGRGGGGGGGGGGPPP